MLARSGDTEEEGWAHLLLATIYQDVLGEFDAARTHLEASRELFDTSGCIHGRILADHFAGNSFLRQGDLQGAVEQYSRALTEARRIGYSAQEAIELAHLPIGQALLGDFDGAERNAQACRQVSRRLGMAQWEGYGAYWLGHVEHERGNLAAARKLMVEALSLFTQVNNQAGIAFIKNQLSRLLRDLGAPSDLGQALEQAEEAYRIASQVGSPPDQIRALSNQAMAHLALGHPAEALSFSQQAIELAGEASAQFFSPEVLYNHAQVLQANNLGNEVRRYLEEAHTDLMARAGRIRDPDLRRSFLENVGVNREIRAEFEGSEAI